MHFLAQNSQLPPTITGAVLDPVVGSRFRPEGETCLMCFPFPDAFFKGPLQCVFGLLATVPFDLRWPSSHTHAPSPSHNSVPLPVGSFFLYILYIQRRIETPLLLVKAEQFPLPLSKWGGFSPHMLKKVATMAEKRKLLMNY